MASDSECDYDNNMDYLDDDDDDDECVVETTTVGPVLQETHDDRIAYLNKKYKDDLNECYDKIKHKLTWLDTDARPSNVPNLRNVMEMTKRVEERELAEAEAERVRAFEAFEAACEAARRNRSPPRMVCHMIFSDKGCQRRACRFIHNEEQASYRVDDCRYGTRCNRVRRGWAYGRYVNRSDQPLCNRYHPGEQYKNWEQRVYDYTISRRK